MVVREIQRHCDLYCGSVGHNHIEAWKLGRKCMQPCMSQGRG